MSRTDFKFLMEGQLRKPIPTQQGRGSAGRGSLLAIQRNPKLSSGVGRAGRARSAIRPGTAVPGNPLRGGGPFTPINTPK